MSLKWPERMPDNGRLSQSDDAWMTGLMRVIDAKMSCAPTLHITLFFDGTNNNDAEDNLWRDSKKHTHTNVARLFNAALHEPNNGIFKSYIPGVGTPFPQIGEPLYSTEGKALAEGFNQRCVWGYTRVLNAVYNAIASDKTRSLIPDDADAQRLCDAGARDNMQGFKEPVHRLGVAHRQAVDESAWPRTVKQIWINVIGFSRGAAGARAFVHKLVNEWAPGGRLGDQTGKYALPYQVNFMGLFDTVASVGLPDSGRSVANFSWIDGHSGFASKGGLAVPDQVQFCVHAFSIHEQRMSFPLDSISQGGSDPGDCRHEIAYPGVHSDVGGGYAPGDQGKARHGDSSKLSQIPLHDMYIAALKYGVPLMRGDAILQTPKIATDFALDPQTVAAFNAWLKTVEPATLSNIGDAMKFGMGQLLSWRTLRARIGTNDYVTEQEFFKRAPEDSLTPRKATEALGKALKTDPQMRDLNAQLAQANIKRNAATTSAGGYPANVQAVAAAYSEIARVKTAIRTRQEALCGEVAHPDAPHGPLPNSARPGEEPGDVTTNDQTDLRQGAEEMRLLLGHLYPEQREEVWKVQMTVPLNPVPTQYPAAPMPVLWVRHDQPGSDSPRITLVDGITHHTVRTTGAGVFKPIYNVADDVISKPVGKAKPFLTQHTSPDAVTRLQRSAQAAIDLFDDYVHDSRCWFRVPHFHEYAPGGYCWPRVVFVGNSDRAAWLGFDPLSVALNTEDSSAAAAFA